MNAQTPHVAIAADGYAARIALRGGQLLSLTSDDLVTGAPQNMIVPAERAEGAFAGSVMAPWPNRIADGTYTHAGNDYQLDINDEAGGAALHGLLKDMELNVESHSDAEVRLHGVLEGSEGYPFSLQVLLAYRVAGHLGLSATLSVRHLAPESADAQSSQEQEPAPVTAPFGAGFHPYLTAADAPLKSCRLRLPASQVAAMSPAGKLLGTHPVSGSLDLSEGPLLAGRTIDHTYTGLPEEAWTSELLHGPSGFMVRLISDTPWAQVYTGENIDRSGVAVEPMTCPPNAFSSGADLVQLEPVQPNTAGGWFRVGYSIEAFRL